MIIEQKIKDMGIDLPESSAPLAMYVPATRIGNTIYVSGQGPFVNGVPQVTGKVGDTRTLEEAQAAARICVINMLSVVKGMVGDLDKVKQVASLMAFVASTTEFSSQHIVVNAASELLFEIFGEKGRHSRTAVGTNQLPLDITVEIAATFEVE